MVITASLLKVVFELGKNYFIEASYSLKAKSVALKRPLLVRGPYVINV
jgi:hypothetical protein